jgi:hypothetical protein
MMMTAAVRLATQPLRHDPLVEGEVRIGAVVAAIRAVKSADVRKSDTAEASPRRA